MKDSGLQGLRGLAILAVAVFHFTVRWNAEATSQPSLYPYGEWFQPLAPLLYNWRLGVELFFVISGFVISLTLNRTPTFKAFWVNRFARLWPPLLPTLPMLALVQVFALPLTSSSPSVLALLQSFTLIDPRVIDLAIPGSAAVGQTTGVLWSLWIELQFYLLASLLFFVFRNRFLEALIGAAICYQLLVTLQFSVYAVAIPYGLYSLAFYIWWFVAGAVFYDVKTRGGSAKHWLVLVAAYMGSCLGLATDHTQPLWTAMLTNGVIFLIFAAFATGRGARFLKNRPLAWLGDVSYEFYLIHEAIGMSLLQWMRVVHAPDSPALVLAPFVVCVPLSWAIYRFWSQPASSFTRKRLTIRPSARQQTR